MSAATDEWEVLRFKALRRDKFTCTDCGVTGGRLHVHHIIPRDDGGEDRLDNLTTLCPDCHAEKHDAVACDICGSVSYGNTSTTLLDRGGGSGIDIGEDCREYIKKSGTGGQRCAVCARIKEAGTKADALLFHGDDSEGELYPVCEECRIKLVFDDRRERERYFDDQLPDSHVDFRHWEGDSDE